MDHRTAVESAHKVAKEVLAPSAHDHDKNGTFNTAAVEALGAGGLLALNVPVAHGGQGLGPRAFADVVAILAETDASVAMVYKMHVCAVQCLVTFAERSADAKAALGEIAKGRHLSTLAFSEKGSRSHFWAPVSKATRSGDGFMLNAAKSWVTSAGHADSYIVSSQLPDAKAPTESGLWMMAKGAAGYRVADKWDALGMRANASSPVTIEGCALPASALLTNEGFKAMLEVVLPWFNLGQAAVALGLCRASVAATANHLKTSRFEHLGVSLGEALPNLRASLATMQIETDGLAARVADTCTHLETPGDLTMLRVLEAKAAAGETAIQVTQLAMRTCGGAAFSRHTSIERFFRDAQAGAVMAPTGDVLRDFIGKALLGIPLF
ncbi:MAG: acyl-CoA dehydrogenase family protein [Polyangiales bacterium]